MATYNYGIDKTLIAAVDLSSYQYYVMVAGSTAGECTVATGHGASAIGILQNDPTAGEEAVVRVFGFSKVRATTEAAASTLKAWNPVKSSSTGMITGFVTSTAGSANWQLGLSTETYSTGSGAYLEMFVTPCWKNGVA